MGRSLTLAMVSRTGRVKSPCCPDTPIIAVGFRAFHHGRQIRAEFMVMGIEKFAAGKIAAAFDHQAFGIHKPAVLPGLLHGQTFRHQGGNGQFGGALPGFARPDEQKGLFTELTALDAQG